MAAAVEEKKEEPSGVYLILNCLHSRESLGTGLPWEAAAASSAAMTGPGPVDPRGEDRANWMTNQMNVTDRELARAG